MGRRALEFALRHDADWTALQFEGLYLDLIERRRGLDNSNRVPSRRSVPKRRRDRRFHPEGH
jgi:hypothetical protein